MANTRSNRRKHVQPDLHQSYIPEFTESPSSETLSPQGSVDDDYKAVMSKRQEQNRAAQRAFRERRAKVLKEMGDRISKLELIIGNVTLQMRRFVELEHDVDRIRNDIKRMQSVVETVNVPTWAIPTSEHSEIEDDGSHGRGGANYSHIMILDALRPSSTDPTLISEDILEIK